MAEKAEAEPKAESRKRKILSDAEKIRIERNKQKALMVRQSKLVSIKKGDGGEVEKSIIKVHGSKYIDSGGGFLLEETPDEPTSSSQKSQVIDSSPPLKTIEAPNACFDCADCGAPFIDSYLMNNFSYCVCDSCRDPDDKHSLITRTEAKDTYLLKDCDLDKREPILRFITRKNPHNIRWGEMKLYLHLEIEKRALEVWETEENLNKQHQQREQKREVTKMRQYNKRIKQLRMDVRSSLYDRTSAASHEHTFGPEDYNEEDDNYSRTCTTCPYSETFEKM